MNIATEQMHSSLAQRIAKVRNCMLVELSTGASATGKEIQINLCQTYEQNSVETSCTTSALSQNALYQAFATSDLTPENVLPRGLVATSEGDTPFRQYRSGFSLIKRPNLADWDDFADWDKGWW